MGRFFNTAGPIVKEDHYYVEPLERMDLEKILNLIDEKKYFVLHAPRQTGKTSFMLALVEYLNNEGKYTALYSNIENSQAARENIKEGIQAVLASLANDAYFRLDDTFMQDNWKNVLENQGALAALQHVLALWCKHNDKPVVLFIDEIDSLIGDTLISVLRQLRSGYERRPAFFPQSVILCGVRDVIDYRIQSSKTKDVITGGSAFNIKAESLRMETFNPDDIENLYLQHTKETDQHFHKDVLPMVWELTEGQPWLVNALAYEVCFNMKEGRDRKKEISPQMILQAKENLFRQRLTHFNQVKSNLKEEQVKKVLLTVLSENPTSQHTSSDDMSYVEELGLIKSRPQLKVTNRIYYELIKKELSRDIWTNAAHRKVT